MAAPDTTDSNAGTGVLVHDEDDVRTIELHRPQVRNALNLDIQRGLTDAIAATYDHPCRVVVLRGAGPSFCAGADLHERDERFAADAPTRRRAGDGWARVLDQLEGLPQPTVAALHGHVVGGGALLALACDLRVGATSTTWVIPEVALGIPLTWAGIPRLVREVGIARARELVMTARSVPATEAERLGLLHSVVEPDHLDAEVQRLATDLAALPAGPMQTTKAAFRSLGRHVAGHELFWSDADLLASSLGSDEAREHLRVHRRQLAERPDEPA